MLYGYRHFHVKTEDIYKYTSEYDEIRFDTSSFKIGRLFCLTKKQKSIWTNEGWTRLTDYERVCWIKNKTI